MCNDTIDPFKGSRYDFYLEYFLKSLTPTLTKPEVGRRTYEKLAGCNRIKWSPNICIYVCIQNETAEERRKLEEREAETWRANENGGFILARKNATGSRYAQVAA